MLPDLRRWCRLRDEHQQIVAQDEPLQAKIADRFAPQLAKVKYRPSPAPSSLTLLHVNENFGSLVERFQLGPVPLGNSIVWFRHLASNYRYNKGISDWFRTDVLMASFASIVVLDYSTWCELPTNCRLTGQCALILGW